MSERFVICDHGVIEASLVPHHLLDRPGKCPYGVYDTFLIIHGDVHDWEHHWDRLRKGCQFLKVDCGGAAAMITREAIAVLAARQNLQKGRGRLRVEVFAEPHAIESGESISFLGAVWPVLSNSNDPVTVAVSSMRRQHGDHRYNYKLLARSYVEDELDAAAERHCGDVIFLNNRDEICEGSYSNVWLLTENLLSTPPITAPCLPGVTRHRVFFEAQQLGLQVEEKVLKMHDVVKADAMFLTSSIRGLQPVGEIEDHHVIPEKADAVRLTTLLANSLLRG